MEYYNYAVLNIRRHGNPSVNYGSKSWRHQQSRVHCRDFKVSSMQELITLPLQQGSSSILDHIKPRVLTSCASGTKRKQFSLLTETRRMQRCCGICHEPRHTNRICQQKYLTKVRRIRKRNKKVSYVKLYGCCVTVWRWEFEEVLKLLQN